MESLSAFDHDGLFYSISGEGSYDENVEKTSPKFSGAISNRFSLGDGVDNFGVAAALSWQERKFGSTTSKPAASGTLPTMAHAWKSSSSATTRSPASAPVSG